MVLYLALAIIYKSRYYSIYNKCCAERWEELALGTLKKTKDYDAGIFRGSQSECTPLQKITEYGTKTTNGEYCTKALNWNKFSNQ